MDKIFSHLRINLLILFVLLNGLVFSQTIVPFSNLPISTTCDTVRDKIVYLHWNGSNYSNSIIAPGVLLRKSPGSISGSGTPGRHIKYVTANTIGNAILKDSINDVLLTTGSVKYAKSLATKHYVDSVSSGGSDSAFVFGGNSFGADAVLGLNDNYLLTFIQNGTPLMTLGDPTVEVLGGFKYTGATPTNNYVMTCDAAGNATWQAKGVTISANQVAYGTGTNTVGGNDAFQTDGGSWMSFYFTEPTSNLYAHGFLAGYNPIGGYGTNGITSMGDVFGLSTGTLVSVNTNTGNVSVNAATTTLNGTVTINGGSPNTGKVLTATNASGDATWQTPSGGADSSIIAGYGVKKSVSTTNITLKADTAVGNRLTTHYQLNNTDTIGTITKGTLGSGTKILVGSDATGDMFYNGGSGAITRLADAATGNALISGGTGTAPSYGKIGLTTHISGVLPEANGGTNQSTYTTGDILQATASNTLGKLNSVSTGSYLRSAGTTTANVWSTLKLPNSATAQYIPFASATNTWGESQGLQWNETNHILIQQANGTTASASGYYSFQYSNGHELGFIGKGSGGNEDFYIAGGFYCSGLYIGTCCGTAPVKFYSANTERMRIISTGQIGMGITAITSPTAQLHIAAGTASASTAPLKFTSGTLMSSAEVGAMEFLTDNYYLTSTTGTTRKTINDLVYRGITADRTLDGSDELINLTSGNRTVTLPTAVSYTKVYSIKNSASSVLTLATTSSQTIDGNSSGSIILNQYDAIKLRSDGSNWIIVQ